MKFLFGLLLLLSLSIYGQQNNLQGYRRAEYTPESLADYLTAGYTTEREKVWSIFRWITDNIAYNVRPYHNSYASAADLSYDNVNDTGALKSLSERVAEGVLQKRVAFCDGYARLFKTLCDYSGIKAEVISGYARTNINKVDSKFRSNHRWNAVSIDNKWYLLDATWASGYVTYSSDFVQLYNPFYYLTPPEDFIRDHYPEDLSWTLLSSPPTLREFHYTPFKNQAYLKHKIVSFKPANGIIEASVGDTINFELETEAPEKKLWISDTAYIDTAAIPIIPVIDSTKTVSIVSGNKVSVKYFVVAENAQWLNLILNNDAVLRYRLKIKKNYTALK